jgi:hypothetical protein
MQRRTLHLRWDVSPLLYRRLIALIRTFLRYPLRARLICVVYRAISLRDSWLPPWDASPYSMWVLEDSR